MRKFTKLVAASAAAMTFGITGMSALNVANASNVNDLINANSQVNSQIHKDYEMDGHSTEMDVWATPVSWIRSGK